MCKCADEVRAENKNELCIEMPLIKLLKKNGNKNLFNFTFISEENTISAKKTAFLRC